MLSFQERVQRLDEELGEAWLECCIEPSFFYIILV